MSLFDNFPLSNAYSVNLDWILKKIKELEEFVRNWTAVNEVRYAGVWDITKQYPSWALVTDGDTSWLSNKPVPVGIPLENAEYWQKLADLDPRIAGIIVNIDAMKTQISSLEGQTATLENKTETLENKTATLENKTATLNKYTAKKLPDFTKALIIGDSFSGDFTRDHGFPGYVAELLKDVNCEDYSRFAFGGDGYVATSGSGRTFTQSFDAVVWPATKANADKYTVILVQGGGNDHKQNTPDEKAGVVSLLNKLKTNYPNAAIYGICGFWPCAMYQSTVAGIQQGYAECGIPLLNDVYMFTNRLDQFLPDQLHPNDAGAKLMASTITAQLVNGVAPYSTFGYAALDKGGCIWTLDSNGILTLDIVFADVAFANQQGLIGTLPVRLRNERDILLAGVYNNFAQTTFIWLLPNGKIMLWNPTASSTANVSGNAYVQYRLAAATNNQEYNI